MHFCRTETGPNEVDVKDLASLPNASEKDAAAPPLQKYGEPGKKQVSMPQHYVTRMTCKARLIAFVMLLGKGAVALSIAASALPVSSELSRLSALVILSQMCHAHYC